MAHEHEHHHHEEEEEDRGRIVKIIASTVTLGTVDFPLRAVELNLLFVTFFR